MAVSDCLSGIVEGSRVEKGVEQRRVSQSVSE